MEYHGYTTSKAGKDDGVLTITFDYPPVHIQGLPTLVGLNILAQKTRSGQEGKVVIFQSANS